MLNNSISTKCSVDSHYTMIQQWNLKPLKHTVFTIFEKKKKLWFFIFFYCIMSFPSSVFFFSFFFFLHNEKIAATHVQSHSTFSRPDTYCQSSYDHCYWFCFTIYITKHRYYWKFCQEEGFKWLNQQWKRSKTISGTDFS